MSSGGVLSNRLFAGQSNFKILRICLPATSDTNQSENEANERSDYDTDDDLPLSELKNQL